jgi:TetR/AcrR family transcriptional regulator, cholesterol catabolism regulator
LTKQKTVKKGTVPPKKVDEKMTILDEIGNTPLLKLNHVTDSLEAACVAHLEMLLAGSDYAQVVVRVLPEDVPAVGARLTALRDDYEDRFRRLIAALALPRGRRRYARLTLLGALNGAQGWYRAGGDSPARIARRVLECLREPLGNATR